LECSLFAQRTGVPLLWPSPVEQQLIDALEDLRSRAGVPIVIHAGYCCPAHNLEVGGVPGSEHTRGLAADIHIPGLTLQAIYELASQVPLFAAGGIGAYDPNFLHVDVRGHRARRARVCGKYVGIEDLVQEQEPKTLLATSEASAPTSG
jgi:hypothetical protein